jgi:hypothetical protein
MHYTRLHDYKEEGQCFLKCRIYMKNANKMRGTVNNQYIVICNCISFHLFYTVSHLNSLFSYRNNAR